jgi:uncharacterized delta-60 repeat protein
MNVLPNIHPLEPRRLLTSGDLDPSFGSHGLVDTNFRPGQNAQAGAIVVQTDGKIIAAGSAQISSTTTEPAIARYKANGALDPTFGTSGKILTYLGKGLQSISDLALTKDGRIVAAAGRFVLRYTSAGKLDKTFDLDGIVKIPISLSDIAVTSDDSIIGSDFLGNVIKLKSNGSIDQSFGSAGIVNIPKLTGFISYEQADVKLQSDGKIILAGDASPLGTSGLDPDVFVTRLTTTGKLDKTFGGGAGFATASVDEDYVVAMAIAPDGKIVVAENQADGVGYILRFTKNGQIDSHFGSDSYLGDPHATFYLGSFNEFVTDVAVAPDGKIIAVGQVSDQDSDSPFSGWGVIRYATDGNLDGTFSFDGVSRFAPNNDFADSVPSPVLSLDHNGRIIVAGTLDNSSNPDSFQIAALQSAPPTIPVATVNANGILIINGTDSSEGFVLDGEYSDVLDTQFWNVDRGDQSIGFDYTGHHIKGVLLNLGSAGDNVQVFESDVPITIQGGAGNDHVAIDPSVTQNCLIFGGPGNDTIIAGAGNDTLFGGPGHDRLYGQAGNDILFAKDNRSDILDGGPGSDSAQRDPSLDQLLNIETTL